MFEMFPLILCSSNKIEKEKKQLAREAGMVRTEVTGAEVNLYPTYMSLFEI